MCENKSLKWTNGCKFVQLQKKHAHHSGNKCIPYKANVGINTPIGLKSTIISKEKWNELKTAKDLYEIWGIPYENDESDSETESFDKFDQNIDSIERETVEPASDDHDE